MRMSLDVARIFAVLFDGGRVRGCCVPSKNNLKRRDLDRGGSIRAKLALSSASPFPYYAAKLMNLFRW